MRSFWYRALPTATCFWIAAIDHVARADAPGTAAGEFFEKSVRPVLVNHCFECHGPLKQKGGLRLDSRDALLAGGDSGPAVVPGQPERSLLIKAINYNDDVQMPPKGQLSASQIAALTTWVRQGATWPAAAAAPRPIAKDAGFKITPADRAFWSFQPVVEPPLPKVKNAGWALTPVDAFILAKLEDKGLAPSPPADPRTLLRRLYFDVIGLPPPPRDVANFVAEWEQGGARRQQAVERVVDALLASPHYGERWARHWLDVARYGEDQAHTFQARLYPQGFRYRDWLIRALNDDMPYDRFLREQLAADLLPRAATATTTAEQARVENLPALGFFALGPVYYGDPKKLDQIDDRIDTLSRGLLGLTVACARCHDHKYDPISAKDYYALAGVIASTDYVEISLEPGKVGQVVEVVKTKDKDKKKEAAPKQFIHAVREGKAVNMKVHIRGNPNMLGDEAPRRMMAILAAEPAAAFRQGSGRLELADAIAAKENPLTARVMVNRIWRQHFGKGLVRTPSNFGQLGERPTHPELLDFLAARFVASGWSMKAMHRLILLSATYQQAASAAVITPANAGTSNDPAQVDAENRLLWRANRRRLEVEAWRDAMLMVAGKLDSTVGGPSGDLLNADYRRRTLYGRVSRHELNPLLRLFDFPDPNITSDERSVTTVPLQQLFVLNSDFLVGNAKALAKRLAAAASDDARRIGLAYELLYGRPATPAESRLGLEFLAGTRATTSGLSRWEQYAQALLSANEFLYVD